jgi:DHA1 family arabinose polymer transporter-like MFS transporter
MVLSIGTTEFVVMGLLPDIVNSLKVLIPVAGYLISAYASVIKFTQLL